jgi:hypothetical protein
VVRFAENHHLNVWCGWAFQAGWQPLWNKPKLLHAGIGGRRQDDDILPDLDIAKGHCRVRSTQLVCGGGPMRPVLERTLGFPAPGGSSVASAPCSVGSRHMNRKAR